VTSRRKKTYLIAIGVGCLALAIDRFALTESVTEPAPSEAAPVVAAAEPVSAATEVPRVPIPAVPFPKNLPAYDATRDIRDVFLAPRERDADGNAIRAGKGPKTDGSDQPGLAAEFAGKHTLNAVLDDHGLKMAVVDGKWIRIGDDIQGCRLTTISGTAARFQCSDGDAVLDISDAAVRIRD